MKKIIFVFVILMLLGIALFCMMVAKMIYTPLQIDNILCEIKQGDTGRAIARTLFENDIIKNEKLFYFLIKYKELDRNLKAGHYLFTGEYGMLDVLDKIVSGEILVKRVTIPEGLSIYRTMRILAERDLGDYDRLLSLASDPAFAREITALDIQTLEGFLYPDTYIFGYNMTEENVVRAMVANFFTKIANSTLKTYDHEQFYKDLILASIVEKEAVFRDEQPLIAGVYLNRLRRNMRLQADPTAVYHLESEFVHRSVVTYSDTRTPTPFNTYVINGLPLHPICSPSVSAIVAVQNPQESNYLFFFANREGRHIFTRSYEEHLSRQREMRRTNL